MSNFIPKKIECIINKIAEPTPKNKILFISLLYISRLDIIFLLFSQYLIKRMPVIIIAGLKIKLLGYTLTTLLIETCPSK